MPRDAQIQMRRDTAANWTSTNPTLAAGEYGFESDTGMVKIGDGTTAWTSLQYVSLRMTEWASGQDGTFVDVFPRTSISSSNLSLGNGNLRATFFTATRTFAVASIGVIVTTAATDTGGTTYRRLALCTVSGSTVTVVAQTANTSTMFNATGLQSYALTSSYTINAGTRYAVLVFLNNSGGTFGAPSIAQINTDGTAASVSPRLNGAQTGLTGDLGTSYTFSGASGAVPFFRLT